ncbi:MAG: preprotein translocase subunit SecE [Candidatus Cloacimonetes bacterium 4572_55]|nr:MAG: preprotein translocase subunit SecE [Candidatus Cloacimonetes bacterium 4572_55]
MVAFLKEVRIELRNVTWPTKEETVNSTWVVLVTVVLIGVFIWMVDIFLQKLVTMIIS